MRFSGALYFASAALVALTTADSGCEVDLEATISDPADSGEVILYKTFIKWANSTDIQLQSSYVDWSNSASAPYSLFFYVETSAGLTLDVLESILEPWSETYLIGGGAPSTSGVQGDYLITNVTCS